MADAEVASLLSEPVAADTKTTEAPAPVTPEKVETVTPDVKPETPATEPKADEAAPVEPPKPEEKTEEKPGAAKATPAPEEISIKLPEGVEADPVLTQKFVPLAKEFGLKSEQAQKLADLYLEAQTTWGEASKKQWAEEGQRWVEVAKKDKEIGGEKFEANLATARKAIRQFGTPALTKTLEDLGLGNNPEVIRFCLRAGKALGNDTVAGTTGSTAPGAEQSVDSLHRQLYPSMYETKG